MNVDLPTPGTPEIPTRTLVEERASASVSKRHRTRQVCFDPAEGYVDTPVLWRPDLAVGTTITGPAIIEEFGSTVPLHPGFVARIDDRLNIIVTKS